MTNSHSPTLHKTIFQVKYRPELRLLPLILATAQKVTSYPNWETDSVKVVLRDYEKHCSLLISPESFAYDQDSSDTALAAERISAILGLLPTTLDPKEYFRFGFRRKFLIPAEMNFGSLASIVQVKLQSQDHRLLKLLPTNTEDLIFKLDANDENAKFHFWVRPVAGQDLQTALDFNIENHLPPDRKISGYHEVAKNYPKQAVLIDIDTYQQGSAFKLNHDTLSAFAKHAQERTTTLANDLATYLFEKKVKK